MITVKGKMLSEDTVAAACQAYGITFEAPKPKHVFRAGDVATCEGAIRIIVEVDDVLTSYDPRMDMPIVEGQIEFDGNHYKYIGRLSDMTFE